MNTLLFLLLFFLQIPSDPLPEFQGGDPNWVLVGQFNVYFNAEHHEYTWDSKCDRQLFVGDCEVLFYLYTQQKVICSGEETIAMELKYQTKHEKH